MKEKIAQKIQDHFFNLGAKISKQDWDFILEALDEYADLKIQECLPEKQSDRMRDFGDDYDTGYYRGFSDCIDRILSNKDKIK